MIAFEVKDMTCGHCASTVTQAVKSVDAAASVSIDLDTHRVEIQASPANAPALQAAIEDAGYTPVPV